MKKTNDNREPETPVGSTGLVDLRIMADKIKATRTSDAAIRAAGNLVAAQKKDGMRSFNGWVPLEQERALRKLAKHLSKMDLLK